METNNATDDNSTTNNNIDNNHNLCQDFVDEERLAVIRRAAGSQSLSKLKDAIKSSGLTNDILSTAGNADGKTPLIMAAWKGTLQNIKYLVEECRVDLDVYSKAQYAYGKTPLFFALTQSRREVVEYLLFETSFVGRCRPPKVCIVNNKGQSVLSLAASHDMPVIVLNRLRSLEKQEEEEYGHESAWWNFRATHSDGLEYGDLDPRFMSRPLLETDIVTEFAINPTTKTTRRNGFARRNPDVVAKEHERKQQQQNMRREAKREKRNREEKLRKEGEREWDQHMEDLSKRDGNAESNDHESLHTLSKTISRIIQLGRQLRRPWIDEVIDRLQRIFDTTYDGSAVKVLLDATAEHIWKESYGDVEIMQRSIDKIRIRLLKTEEDGSINRPIRVSKEDKQSRSGYTKMRKKQQHRITDPQLDMESWKEAFQNVERLPNRPMSMLESPGQDALSLPSSHDSSTAYVLVDSLAELVKLHLELDMNMALSTSSFQRRLLLAIDTEWYDSPEDHFLSTFQLSFCDVETGDSIHAYVVDLLVGDESYQKQVLELFQVILFSEDVIVLGFAIGHDISMIRKFVNNRTTDMLSTASIKPSIVLDLQRFFASSVLDKQGNRISPPGLKKCAAHFSTVPLSKNEQCSDWKMRPLRQQQFEYAALDALVLLPLLACGYRQVNAC